MKAQLEIKSPKTVNNILAVLSILLKKAVEWDVIERMPCRIKLLPIEKGAAAFHDFDEYERLVDVARAIDQRTYLIVLLGGEAGVAVRLRAPAHPERSFRSKLNTDSARS